MHNKGNYGGNRECYSELFYENRVQKNCMGIVVLNFKFIIYWEVTQMFSKNRLGQKPVVL